MKRKVVIFGLSGVAQVAKEYLDRDSSYDVVAFTAHEKYISQGELAGKKVVPFEAVRDEYPPDEFAMFVAMSYNSVNKPRAEVYELCKSRGYELITYVSSKATVWDGVPLGDNCFIFENNVVQPFVRIGSNVIMWSGNHIGHDTEIGDHCFISSHVVISGNVNVGPYCFIGVNATIRNGVTIAPECIIGAGALILKDTVEKGVYGAKGTKASSVTSDKLGRP